MKGQHQNRQFVHPPISQDLIDEQFKFLSSENREVLDYIRKIQKFGLKVVIRIIGLANVGKSTLVNEMIGFYDDHKKKGKFKNGLISRDQQECTAFKVLYSHKNTIQDNHFQYFIQSPKEKYPSYIQLSQIQQKTKENFFSEVKGVDRNILFVGRSKQSRSYFQDFYGLQNKIVDISQKSLQLIKNVHMKRREFIRKLSRQDLQNLQKKIITQKLLDRYSYMVISSNLKILNSKFLSQYTCICDTGGTNDRINSRNNENSLFGNEDHNQVRIKDIDSQGDIYVYVHNFSSGALESNLFQPFMNLTNHKNPSKIIICFNFSNFLKESLPFSNHREQKNFLRILKNIPNELLNFYNILSQRAEKRLEETRKHKKFFQNTVEQQAYQEQQQYELKHMNEMREKLSKFSDLASRFIMPNEQECEIYQLQQKEQEKSFFQIHQERIKELFDVYPFDNLFVMAQYQSKEKLSPLILQFFKLSEKKYANSLIHLTKRQLKRQYEQIDKNVDKIIQEVKKKFNQHSSQLNNHDISLIKNIKESLQAITSDLSLQIKNKENQLSNLHNRYSSQIINLYAQIITSYSESKERSNYAIRESFKEKITEKIQKGINKRSKQYTDILQKIRKQLQKLTEEYISKDKTIKNSLSKKHQKSSEINPIIESLILNFKLESKKLANNFILYFNDQWQQFINFNFQACKFIGINLKLFCAAITSVIGASVFVIAQLGWRVVFATLGAAFFVVASSITGGATLGVITYTLYSNHKQRKAIDKIFFQKEFPEFNVLMEKITSQKQYIQFAMKNPVQRQHTIFEKKINSIIQSGTHTINSRQRDQVLFELQQKKHFLMKMKTQLQKGA